MSIAAAPAGFRKLAYHPYPVADSDAGPVWIHPDDRKYGCLLVGGQGSGKTSAMLRLALNDVADPDTAVIVFDPKSELSQLLLDLIPPDCGKEVWYLNLGHPAFGMSPLRLPNLSDFSTEATGIGEGIVSSLLDINEGQIFQSSKRYLYHSVIGELAMARLEQRRPQFEGVYGLLMPKRDDLREAAANACHHIPDLDQTAEFFRKELPDDLLLSGSSVAQRLDAPRNKVSTLVGIPALRRFFNHPTDVPLSRIIKGRGVLLVDANMATIGEENAEACIAFIFRALHNHMQHQVQWPEEERPRVALLADEAHYLINENVVDQIATHRAAGLDVTLGLQFFGQLGASALSAAASDKIRSGILNLVQSRCMFRLGNPQDAEEATRIAMAVYETMIRADRESRAHQRATPEQILNLPVWHFLASWIANGSRASSFIGRTYPFPKLQSHKWRDHHLEHMTSRVQPYPEMMGHTYRRQVDPAAIKTLAAERAARENGTADSGNSEPDSAPAAKPPSRRTPRREPHRQLRLASAQERASTSSDDTSSSERPADSEPEELPATPLPARDDRGNARESADPDFDEDGSIKVDNFKLLPLPELDTSDVRRLVGNLPRGATPFDGETEPGEGEQPPWLLRELAFIDRYHECGALEAGNGRQPKLSASDYGILMMLDRIGLVLRDSLGRAALGEGAALRTVQYRLKRLYDAGLVSRAEISIANATGRLPQIYALTNKGLKAAQARVPPVIHPERKFQEPEGRTLTVPHNHHALHWLLQLQELVGPEVITDYWRTDRYATGRFTPPQVGGGRGRHQLTLSDIAVPGGQMLTGLQSVAADAPTGVTRGFREIRPDLSIEVRVKTARRGDGQPGLTFDLLVEIDRAKPSHNRDKYVDYDAFLSGWWSEHRRYRTLGTRPAVVVVCDTWERAQQNAALADKLMTGSIGHSGTPPQDWYYPGRDHIFFMAEADIYYGSLRALALHPWPPPLRQALGHGTHPQPTIVSLLPPTMIAAWKHSGD